MADVHAEAAARRLLVELEERLASKQLDRILDVYTDDAVLIGDDGEHLTHDETVAYLTVMAEMAPVIRWEWERVVATEPAPGVLGLLAAGTLGFTDAAGELLAPREAFRLGCLAVETGGTWRIVQFHGSRPSH